MQLKSEPSQGKVIESQVEDLLSSDLSLSRTTADRALSCSEDPKIQIKAISNLSQTQGAHGLRCAERVFAGIPGSSRQTKIIEELSLTGISGLALSATLLEALIRRGLDLFDSPRSSWPLLADLRSSGNVVHYAMAAKAIASTLDCEDSRDLFVVSEPAFIGAVISSIPDKEGKEMAIRLLRSAGRSELTDS